MEMDEALVLHDESKKTESCSEEGNTISRSVDGSTEQHLELVFVLALYKTTVEKRITLGLFPFDGAGRFRANVVNHAINSFDFRDNPSRDASQQVVRETRLVGRHSVDAGNGANGNHALVRSLVAHHANSRNR